MKDPPALRLACNPRQRGLRVIVVYLALYWKLFVHSLVLSFGHLDEVRMITMPFFRW